MRSKRKSPVWLDSQLPLAEWYSSGLGQSILSELDQHLHRILPGIFGYRGLQLGQLGAEFDALSHAGIHRGVTLNSPGNSSDIEADVVSLPIASQVMKLVVLPHTLDFCDEPYQVLRETDRVLTDDGHIVIIGFNPYSQFGARRMLVRWRRQMPWSGHFYARRRLIEWLSVLNYRIVDSTSLFIRPPINSVRLQTRLSRMESLQPWLKAVGAVYVLHAQKQTLPLTPARRVWRRQRTGIRVGSFAGSNRLDPRPVAQPVHKPVVVPLRRDDQRQGNGRFDSHHVPGRPPRGHSDH